MTGLPQDEMIETQEASETRRATVPAMEAMLFKALPVLDHGFVRVIDYMGDDSAVVQAARVSYGRGTKTTREDRGLIRYLMRHQHTTPFEMCEIKLHVKLPIFVARQWIRHRTANVNEYSARYSIMDKEFYIPVAEQLAAQSTRNRQGREDILSQDQAKHIMNMLREDSERSYATYQWLMNEDTEGAARDPNRQGLSRELARIGLSLNVFTQWYWKTDLHNLLHFLRLRSSSHAQYEIRVYADLISDIVRQWTPFTYEAFCDYQLNSITLSSAAIEVVRRKLRGELVDFQGSGLSEREWNELLKSFDLAAPRD